MNPRPDLDSSLLALLTTAFSLLAAVALGIDLASVPDALLAAART